MMAKIKPEYSLKSPKTEVYVGDCREILPALPKESVDLIFADPPFNWNVSYAEWNDRMAREDYIEFTHKWLDECVRVLAPHGAIWVNIPDDTAAEIVMHLKYKHKLYMMNWCIWHFRFGQCRNSNFIVSKVHALYFVKNPKNRRWNQEEILEPSDRSTKYADHRTTQTKTPGMRVPLDVWYGKYWGRIQGNNEERRTTHQNQIPEVYLERIIRACSKEDDLVLDPFLGSGTTCTVARTLGRQSIGIEYSACMAESAFTRINKGTVRIENLFMKKLIKKAFFNTHQGFSTDELIMCDELRKAFLEKCKVEMQKNKISYPGEYQCNHELQRLRKAGELGRVTKTGRITDRTEYQKAEEIAKQIKFAEINGSLDEIMCDPKLRQKFDQMAKKIAQDVDPYLVRRAALKLRKEKSALV